MNIRANAHIGSPIERVEDYRFLRGEGQFVADLARGGALHAVVLRSSIAHGLIRSIDGAEARRLPGVRAVITAVDVGERLKIPLRQTIIPEGDDYLQQVTTLPSDSEARTMGHPTLGRRSRSLSSVIG